MESIVTTSITSKQSMPHFLRAPNMRRQCYILIYLTIALSAHAICIDLDDPVPKEMTIATGEIIVVQLPASQPAILSLSSEGTDATQIADLDLGYAPRANGISMRFEGQWISIGRIGQTETIRGRRFTLTTTQREGNTVTLSFTHTLPHNSRAIVALHRGETVVSSVSLIQGAAKTLRPQSTPPPAQSPAVSPTTTPATTTPSPSPAPRTQLPLIQKQTSGAHQLHHAEVKFMIPAERADNGCSPETWRSTAHAFAAVNEYYPQSPPLIRLSAQYYEGIALLAAGDTNAATTAFRKVTLPAQHEETTSRAEIDVEVFVDATASQLTTLGVSGSVAHENEEVDDE